MDASLALIVGAIVSAVLGGLLFRTHQQKIKLEARLILQERQHQALQTELQEAMRLRERLFQVSRDALLFVNADNQEIIAANAIAKALLGQNILSETLIAATRSYDLEKLAQEAKTDLEEMPEQMLEIGGRFVRGRVIYIADLQKPLYVLLLRDETELQRLGRARREMVANISHELRHPIGNIQMMADTLLKGALKKPKRSEKYVQDIRVEVDKLGHLVQEMRDLSLIESGEMPVKLVPTLLSEVVNLSVNALTSLAEHRQQTIKFDVPETIIVLADANQLQRVIGNIVHNAIKFAPESGRIQIGTTCTEDEVTVAISNNGPNIPGEDLNRIFERFFQVDRARGDGTGLGLAIARHIVIAHGGKIWAINNGEDEGVTFFFTLALSDIPIPTPA